MSPTLVQLLPQITFSIFGCKCLIHRVSISLFYGLIYRPIPESIDTMFTEYSNFLLEKYRRVFLRTTVGCNDPKLGCTVILC